MGKVDCPGHFGHILLPLPVYHPILFDHLYELLLGMCTTCDDFHVDPRAVICATLQLKTLNETGDVAAVERLQGVFSDHVTNKRKGESSREEMEAVYNEAIQRHNEAFPTTPKSSSSLGKTNKIFHDRRIAPVRNLVVKSFIGNHMRKRPKRCKNCGKLMLKLVQ